MNQDKIERFAARYVNFVEKRKWKAFFVILAILVVSLIPTVTKLQIHTDLATLLPEGTPSVIALEESYHRFGSTDRFMIAIQAKDPYLVARLQDSIQEYINANWQDDIISKPQVKNDNSFFTKNALIYLPVEHLERIRDNLEDIQLEIGRKNGPLVVDLLADSTTEPAKKERVWFDANLPQALGLPDEAADAFESFFKKKDGAAEAKEEGPKRNLPKELKTRLIGEDKHDSTLFNGVVQCKLVRPSTDVDFVKHILLRSDTLLAKFNAVDYGQPVLMTVEGSYEGLNEVNDIMSDSAISMIIAVVLIFLIVAVFFRSPIKAPLLMLAQVSLACSLAMCFTTLYYGALNPFTVLVSSIILGMGVDYSIHFMGTCQRCFTACGDLKLAMEQTVARLLRPMFLAALTTIAGLLSLLIAKFVGFYEFGVISAVGILFSFLTAIFAMPVFIFVAGGLPPRPRNSFFPKAWSDEKIVGFFKRAAIVGAVFSVVMLCFLPNLEFEYNFRNLRRPPKENVEQVKKTISTGNALSSNRKSSTPAAVMASRAELLDSLYDTLMVRMHTEHDSTLRSFLTLKTFLPSQADQQARMEVIDEIKELAEARVFDRATGEDSVNIATLRTLAEEVAPFTVDSLPEWAVDLLKEKDGSVGKIGFIYGRYNSSDAREAADWQDRFGHWEFGGEKLKVFSSQFILADVVRAVKYDSMRMAFVVILVIIIILAFSLRKPKLVAISAGSLLIGLLWSAGLLGLMNVVIGLGHIGIYNVVVIPAVLGLAIDSTIHLLVGWTQDPSFTPRTLVDNIGRLVMASSVTTAAGFAGALGVEHKGLRTIGELATTSILAFLVASLVFTVFFSIVFLKRK
ncbi:efflux RND transporter permease subunit [Fibrobacter sp. UBA4309]|uniref:efflux RND transporter permease subunit n=1 Tax=Fibrobacter sp. UBA4309 TaxID=1946537 RepID=UPI0025C1B584|nr:MMPL family transporter [Fibrobacter sp. UBA4309]